MVKELRKTSGMEVFCEDRRGLALKDSVSRKSGSGLEPILLVTVQGGHRDGKRSRRPAGLNKRMNTLAIPHHATAAERLKLLQRITRALQTSLKQVERAKSTIEQEVSASADA